LHYIYKNMLPALTKLNLKTVKSWSDDSVSSLSVPPFKCEQHITTHTCRWFKLICSQCLSHIQIRSKVWWLSQRNEHWQLCTLAQKAAHSKPVAEFSSWGWHIPSQYMIKQAANLRPYKRFNESLAKIKWNIMLWHHVKSMWSDQNNKHKEKNYIINQILAQHGRKVPRYPLTISSSILLGH
jgi:hypothetical protein